MEGRIEVSKYYDMNTAAEDAGKDAMPTPCEMFNKMQGLQHDYDMLLMRFTKKCKEHDDVMRTLDQTTVKLNDETARADALQRRCDDLEKSRQAWVRKCELFMGLNEDIHGCNLKLSRSLDEYVGKFNDLRAHPWRNLWRHIKEALGLA